MAIETYRFADDGQIPNSALPLLVYRQARRGAWRNGIYDFHHFHSTSHEVLGIAAGEALVRFGGTHGQSVAVVAGDVVAIPAGVGHCLERGSRDLLVVGAYPEGRAWDLRRGDPAERVEVLANIAAVPLPTSDPLDGAGGLLVAAWTSPGPLGGR
jgi:uncharacterized protein YjlB